jgi:hypothetical protein
MSETADRQHLGAVRKNATQEIRVSVGTYGGVPYVYAFVCLNGESSEDEAERHPGLTIRAHTLRPLIPLLSQALEIAEAREGEIWGKDSLGRGSKTQEPERWKRRR